MRAECMIDPAASLTRKKVFPSQSFVVETSTRTFAWDTGYAHHFFQSLQGVYKLYGWVTPVQHENAQSLREQLHRQHQTIDAIVVSHFHADHMAGLADFPNTPVLASRAAWNSIQGKKGIPSLLQAYIPSLLPEATLRQTMEDDFPVVDLRDHDELQPLLEGTRIQHGWSLDTNGEAIAVELPGHAKGHIGLLVRTQESPPRWELIASDAAWSHQAYNQEKIVMPHAISFIIQDQKSEYRKTLSDLQVLFRRGVRIHLSHEPLAASSPNPSKELP